MLSVLAAPPTTVLVVLAALGLLLVGGLLVLFLSARAKMRFQEKELAEMRQELQERSMALAEAEAQVERVKKIPKSELLPMLKLAHEQRSPLAAIQNALDMLLEGYATEDQALQEEMLGLARDRAATMLDRVNAFLRLGSVRHAEIERTVQPVQLLDVLKRLVPEKQVQAKWRAVELKVDIPDSLPAVMATTEDMEHLLSNLINNAIKYTNPGGRVTVSLKNGNGHVLGAVEDTGIGIAPEDLPKIFDEFYRAERAKDMAHGTGLGLSIVKRVVDLYGGHMDVESEPGKGSKFTFVFPTQVASREKEKTKTFHTLHEEVIGKGICSRCSACVSFCSAGTLNALHLDPNGLPCYADEDKCLRCGICYLICPRTRDLDGEVRRRFGWRAPIGTYETITSVRATEGELLKEDASKGVMAALLLYMLENYLVQGSIVSRETDAFNREPILTTTREELISAICPNGSSVSTTEGHQDRYTTYTPIMSMVKDLGTSDFSCVAVIGTPCQIRTVRKMQCLGIGPASRVGYAIGPFCMENFSFDARGRERLEDKLCIELSRVSRLVLKDDVSFVLTDGGTVHVPFEEVEEIARPACLACTEFANDYADIAVGGLGSPEGYATTIIRTEKGHRLYTGALRQGYIEERTFADPVEMQTERTKLTANVVAFAQRKRERGEVRLRELGASDPIRP
jgi:coenzyme F420 hydrogenase subunit beta